ncbi:MAG: 2-polyprenyl-3-methyl-5-hydroxy-6-metoxy-1,4-benzoquinol methylase [Candidatus Poriferisodalaceae bacterium]|jgi:2-polyprenyl-3-methyl-5-hydroxy-6-metoxy-1,4-benzoquinol methylase
MTNHDQNTDTEIVNEWDEYAEGWDGDDAARTYAASAFASLEGLLDARGATLAAASVIDSGCGTGLLTEQLVAAGAVVHAVDTSPAMLSVLDAKIARHGWATVTTSTSLPPNDVSFDLVFCSSVCSFLDDYPGAVRDLDARLAPRWTANSSGTGNKRTTTLTASVGRR